LRYAVSVGCKILKTHNTIYYPVVCRPFKQIVNVLYNLRNDYKKEVPYNPMEFVVKILMNSLYGKFGEKFGVIKSPIHKTSITEEQLTNGVVTDKIDDWYYISEIKDPASHCIPIWAVYVTAYARIKMCKTMTMLNTANPNSVIYTDTDSIITRDTLPTGKGLGEFKLEQKIKTGYFVRPKLYLLEDEDGTAHTTSKGVPKKIMTPEVFMDLINNPKIKYTKIVKYKESIRRRLQPNEVIDTSKILNLEDTKRDWGEEIISFNHSQESDPLKIGKDGKPIHRVANLKAIKKPTINNGVNSMGEVAPTIK
jgi:hypothetical protein